MKNILLDKIYYSFIIKIIFLIFFITISIYFFTFGYKDLQAIKNNMMLNINLDNNKNNLSTIVSGSDPTYRMTL